MSFSVIAHCFLKGIFIYTKYNSGIHEVMTLGLYAMTVIRPFVFPLCAFMTCGKDETGDTKLIKLSFC